MTLREERYEMGVRVLPRFNKPRNRTHSSMTGDRNVSSNVKSLTVSIVLNGNSYLNSSYASNDGAIVRVVHEFEFLLRQSLPLEGFATLPPGRNILASPSEHGRFLILQVDSEYA